MIFAPSGFAAGNIDASFNAAVTDGLGYVNHTLTQPDGKILAFGYFQKANGAHTGNIVRFNADGTLDPDFNAVLRSIGRVNAVKRQSDGKILIGGIFEYVGGVRRTNIARLNADGSLDNSFNPSPELFDYIPNYVFDIELQSDGKILDNYAFCKWRYGVTSHFSL